MRISAPEALTGRAADLAAAVAREVETDDVADLAFWTSALDHAVTAYQRESRLDQAGDPDGVRQRLTAIEARAREMAVAMDFAFLLDPELLSIGLLGSRQRARPQLLRSPRLRIAPGQPLRRGQGRCPGAALVPPWTDRDAAGARRRLDLLVRIDVRVPDAVARHAGAGRQPLERTNGLVVVERQQICGRSLQDTLGHFGIGLQCRDLEFAYQYSNTRVPWTGLEKACPNAVVRPTRPGSRPWSIRRAP